VNVKHEIETELSLLIRLAEERKTTQGNVVFTKALEQLRAAGSESEVLEVLGKVNHACSGIEAHGSLTASEYASVSRLRELAANNSLQARRP
jgi:hypothetical protein